MVIELLDAVIADCAVVGLWGSENLTGATGLVLCTVSRVFNKDVGGELGRDVTVDLKDALSWDDSRLSSHRENHANRRRREQQH